MVRKVSLIYSLAVLVAFCTTLITPVDASSNNIGVHARMIKKRVAAADDSGLPLIGVAPDPKDQNDPNNPNTPPTNTAVSPSGTAQSGAPVASASNSATPSASDNGNPLLPSITIPGLNPSLIPSSSANSSLSSTGSQSSSTASSSTSQSTSLSTSTSGTSIEISTVVATPTAQDAASSATNSANTSGAASGSSGHLTRNTIIAIVVVAACVGGAVVIWTVIRKWKFAPSDEFGDRLNPIDWRPSSGEKEKDSGALDAAGASHRRNGSRGSNRSFVSADAHGSNSGHNHNNSNGNMIPDLPSHDFTAGAAVGHGGLAPVGAYADLRRGPSPTPSMGEQYYRGYGATQYGRTGY